MMDGMFMGMGALIMTLLWLLTFVAGVGVGVLWQRHNAPRPQLRGPDPLASAQRVLADRLARGEIDEDEFLRRSSALGLPPS